MKDLGRCRASHAYPGEPLEVWYQDHWQPVSEVLEEMHTPAGKRYRVICEDRNEFWLEYDPALDNWQVFAVGEPGIKTNKENQ